MAAGTKHYSAELKRDAVAELVGRGSTEWAAMKKTADLPGVGTAETVRQWVRQAPGGAVSASDASVEAAETEGCRPC